MSLPKELERCATRALELLAEKQPENLAQWQGDARESLTRSMAMSDFITESVLHDETLLPWLVDNLAAVSARPLSQ